MPRIRINSNIRVSLINNSLITLTNYVVILINIEEIECMIKT